MSLCKSGNIVTLPAILHQDQGGAEDAQNLSAQKETETEGTRFQKENGYSRRQKRTQEKTRQRQKETFLLIFLKNTDGLFAYADDIGFFKPKIRRLP